MQQFQQLKQSKSIKIEKGTLCHWNDKTVELDPNKIVASLKGKKAYANGGKVIAYVSGEELYVTPFTQESLNTLRNNGYKEFAFFVPLSPQGMYLLDDELAATWQSIVAQSTIVCRSMNDRRAQLAQSRPFAQPAVATA